MHGRSLGFSLAFRKPFLIGSELIFDITKGSLRAFIFSITPLESDPQSLIVKIILCVNEQPPLRASIFSYIFSLEAEDLPNMGRCLKPSVYLVLK